MVMNLQSIIDQHTATIQQLQERIDGDAVKYNQKCQYCEKLERELAIEKSKNQVHQDYMDALSRKGPLVSLNVSGNVDISKDAPDVGRIKTPVEPSKAIATTNPPPPTIESFSDRVKSIIQLAASKNGQTIRCKAKGHISFYTFFINADCLCRAVDEMVDKELERTKEFLGGNLYNVQLSKVCYFIGHIIRMNIINDVTLQMNDILFAFEPYYANKASLHTKLCDKTTTPSMNVFMGIFEGLLRRYSS